MSDQNDQLAVAQGLQQEWGIAIPEIISEETILEQLQLKVVQILERGPEAFFQLMYRLDISERKLQDAMYISKSPAASIARLIYVRQWQKMKSRAAHRNTGSKPDAADELSW
jgi:hypothetical protein